VTTLIPNQVTTGVIPPASPYGKAAGYDFDNPDKWVTVNDVPLLDEHEMTDEAGNPVAYVDRAALQEIAANNNKRVIETGDPATLILGHTSDDPRAPEKPAKGFVVNYKVKPFKRDPQTGQVLYAIHGDYKVRPKNAHLIEEFPRRSVELWWNKKELDPVAMLGGTTPERDLSVIIRKARLRHTALLGGTVPDRDLTTTVRFSRHGRDTIEHYTIDHRTSDRPRKFNKGCDMPRIPSTGPARYAADGVDDTGNDSDFDDGFGQPDDSPMVAGGPGDEFGDDGDEAETDPTIAKVFQSKQWKDLTSKIDMLVQALGEQAQPGQEDPMAGGPPPGPGGMPGEGMDDGSLPEDQDEQEMGPNGQDNEMRRGHGEEPVQFESTGFPGPGSTNVPAFGGKGRKAGMSTSYNRNGHTTNKGNSMNRNDPAFVRMQRHVEGLQLKLSRQDAEKQINALKAEGIIFGDTPQEAAQAEAEEKEFLALLSDDDRAYQVNIMRKRYKRAAPNPANPAYPGAARYSRQEGPGAEADDFEPQNSQEAADFADLITVRKMSKAEAIKFMRSRGRR
jgi:hypothetical protein